MNNLIGSATDCEEGGKGLLFKVLESKTATQTVNETDAIYPIPAFVIRYDNQLRAYLNRCGHIAIPLDYQPGQFFSDDGSTLICSTHGAEYAPDTGACLGGPCFGIGLEPIEIDVIDNHIFLRDMRYSLLAAE